MRIQMISQSTRVPFFKRCFWTINYLYYKFRSSKSELKFWIHVSISEFKKKMMRCLNRVLCKVHWLHQKFWFIIICWIRQSIVRVCMASIHRLSKSLLKSNMNPDRLINIELMKVDYFLYTCLLASKWVSSQRYKLCELFNI